VPNIYPLLPRPEALAELKESKLDFRTFSDLNDAVVKDVDFLKNSKLIKKDIPISGWIYDVRTGKTTKIV
jgi:carbonic anhydrase